MRILHKAKFALDIEMHQLFYFSQEPFLHSLASPPNALIAFVKRLEQDDKLQSKLKVAENPNQIIDIAESAGFTITSLELQTCSSDLSAHYFPWANKGNEYHRNFFKRKGQVAVSQSGSASRRGDRRPKRRELFCSKHPEQRIKGNGKKYFLHLLPLEALRARGMADKRRKLVINAYPVLVLSNLISNKAPHTLAAPPPSL